MVYQIFILESYSGSQHDCWLGYDQCFLQQAASQSNCELSDMDSTLWNMAFTGQAKLTDAVIVLVCFILPKIVS